MKILFNENSEGFVSDEFVLLYNSSLDRADTHLDERVSRFAGERRDIQR
jgi:hypothetical protein